MTIKELREKIEAEKVRGAWAKGVKAYALELLEEMDENSEADKEAVSEKSLMNGADTWSEYSWGGSALIYDGDIAARLCSPSKLKKIHDGERRPNASEEWLDVQARALYQAARMIRRIARG
jgi:hypothetical protein